MIQVLNLVVYHPIVRQGKTYKHINNMINVLFPIINFYYNLIYSTRTSCRSARKQQRKMWNLKKGNFREEPTIVLTLKQIIEKLDKFKGYHLIQYADVQTKLTHTIVGFFFLISQTMYKICVSYL